MNTLLPTIDRLFECLLRSSWEASVLAIVIYGTQMLLRRTLSARWRFALWLLVVARLCLPVLPPRPFALPTLRLAGDTSAPLSLLPGSPDFAPVQGLPASPPRELAASTGGPQGLVLRVTAFQKHRMVLIVWGVGALAFAAAFLLQRRRLTGTLRQAVPCEDRTALELLAACAAELGLRRPIRLVETPDTRGPAIVGSFRQTLLLPTGFTTQFSQEELRVIFLHELAHVRRGDLAINSLLTGLQIFHWFNPVLWWAFRRLREDRELATDALVLSDARAPLKDLYGRTLLKLVERGAGAPLCPQSLGIMETNTHLKDRMTRIMKATPTAYRFSAPGLLLLGVLGVTALTQETPSPTLLSGQSKEAIAAANAKSVESGEPANEKDDTGIVTGWYLEGIRLAPEAVANLEKNVIDHPDDLAARVKILGFHFRRRVMEPDSRSAAQPHILWIIRNRPASSAAGSPMTSIMQIIDPDRYAEARGAWMEQLAKSPNDPTILGNAASFFLLNDMPEAEALIRSAQALDPKNSRWAERLGHLLSMKATRGDRPTALQAHRDSLDAFKKALEGKTGQARFYGLGPVAEAALRSGDLVQADSYAHELLSMAPNFESDWNYGNAIYTGNVILGRISLEQKDLPAARSYLLAAGDTPGSPQLDSFGPDLTLAKQLLERGEKESVAAFFGKIGKFWKGHEAEVKDWQKAVEAGVKPDFGMH